MGLCMRVRRLASSVCCVSAPDFVENPFGFAKVPGCQDPSFDTQPPTPVAEEYQITFFWDNLFLPGVMSEIRLTNVPVGKAIRRTR